MYKCQACNVLSKENQSVNKLITEIRKKAYSNTVIAKKFKKEKVTNGWEIVKEIQVCKSCFDLALQKDSE